MIRNIDNQMIVIALDFLNKKNNVKGVGDFLIYLKNNFANITQKYSIESVLLADIVNQVYTLIQNHGVTPRGPDIVIRVQVSLEESFRQKIKSLKTSLRCFLTSLFF